MKASTHTHTHTTRAHTRTYQIYMSTLQRALFSKEALISWTIAGFGAYYLYLQQTKTSLDAKYEKGQELMKGKEYQTFLEEHKKKNKNKTSRGWFTTKSTNK